MQVRPPYVEILSPIDGDAILKAHRQDVKITGAYSTGLSAGLKIAISSISSMSNANVKEAVRGEWIQVCGDNKFVCSECGRQKPKLYAEMVNYCGHCGASMEEEEEENGMG